MTCVLTVASLMNSCSPISPTPGGRAAPSKVKGTLVLALRRGIITRNPMDGLAPSERPKQRNARKIAVLTRQPMEKLVAAATTERWEATLGLAPFAGLRLGEVRGLRWGDIDFESNTISISRSPLPDGTAKAPKSAAGVRTVPLLPKCTQCPTSLGVRARGSRERSPDTRGASREPRTRCSRGRTYASSGSSAPRSTLCSAPVTSSCSPATRAR